MINDNQPTAAELDSAGITSIEAEAAPEPIAEQTFADFGIHPDIVAALEEKGIVHPFPIQAMTLPVALSGHDIIGQARTGTGKTLGFGVPLLSRVTAPGETSKAAVPAPEGKPQAMVVVPTRELAVQVASDLEAAAKKRGIRIAQIYGGRAFEPQVERLEKGIEVIVGTPGRIIDLATRGHLDLAYVGCLVLDEADEMLDLGFLPDVEKILAMTPGGRQTMLFSATMPGAVVTLARRYMTQPTHIRAMQDDTSEAETASSIEQFVYRAHAMDKVEMLARILQAKDRGLTIIFSRTKRTAAKVSDELISRGFAAAPLHGDLGQGAREQALRAFRSGKVDVLVATDVAARGIDVEDVTHVINYQCPEDEKTYVHRIGRTGRAGKTGIAVTLVDWDDLHRWALINKALDLGIPEPEETYSSSEHLFEDLEIPANATGSLPKSARTREGLDAERVEDLGETGRSDSRQRGERRPRRDDERGRSGGRGGRSGGRGGERQASGGSSERRPRRDAASTEGSDGSSQPRRRRRRTRGGAGEAPAAD